MIWLPESFYSDKKTLLVCPQEMGWGQDFSLLPNSLGEEVSLLLKTNKQANKENET